MWAGDEEISEQMDGWQICGVEIVNFVHKLLPYIHTNKNIALTFLEHLFFFFKVKQVSPFPHVSTCILLAQTNVSLTEAGTC